MSHTTTTTATVATVSTKKAVREIQFEVTLEGQGVVQRDSTAQQWLYKSSENRTELPKTADGKTATNFTLAKANYYREGDKVVRKIKLSSAWLRHEIHVDSIPFYSPEMFDLAPMRKQLIATPDYLLRGYMHAPKKDSLDTLSTRRKSPYVVTDAEEVSGVIPTMEVRTTTGPRNDTSLFSDETCGKTRYVAEGSIDISLLRFVSCSDIADRRAIREDDMADFQDNFEAAFGKGSVRLGMFYTAAAEAMQSFAEKGFMLEDAAVVSLVNTLFAQMAKVNKACRGAYAKTSKIRVRFVCNPLEDMGTEWVDLFDASTGDLATLDFKPAMLFRETTLEDMNKVAGK